MRQTLLALVLAAGLAMPAIADDKKATPPTPPADPTNTVGNMAKDADKKIEEAKQMADAEIKKLAGTKADAPAEPAKKWIIAADAKPVERKELEGGLIIEDFVVGTGVEFKPDSTVVINYHGTLKDGGNTFDSSFERGQPVAFPLGQLIPGWQKGVPGMKAGGLRRLTVPWAMAYGEQGRPPQIPAKADLVFVIEALGAPSYVDVAQGSGDETVNAMSVAITNHVIKGKDGKIIHQTAAGKPYIWFPGEIQGLGEQLAGMKVGGKRTITLPGAMIQPSPMMNIQLPAGEDLTIEAELVMFRNLPGR